MDKINLQKIMLSAQEWLEENYPQNGVCLIYNDTNNGKTREQITNLFLSQPKNKKYSKKLSGSLDLNGFINLRIFTCGNNLITKLVLPNTSNLEKLILSHNSLNQLDLNKHVNLEELDIKVNKFSGNPVWISHLVSLKKLDLSYNRNFTGSLEFTKNMSKLETLIIEGTNFTSGLEYLPAKLKNFCCWSTNFANQLEKYGRPGQYGHYDYTGYEYDNHIHLLEKWKKDHSHLVNNAKLITDLENCQTLLQQSFLLKKNDFWWTRDKLTLNALNNPNQGFQLWAEEKIRKLRAENEEYYQSIEITPKS